MQAMAIVTPIWKPSLSNDERGFLSWTQWSNPSHDRWFAVPQNLDVGLLSRDFPDWGIRRFPSCVFESVRSYSTWLTQPDFYEAFAAYEFVTICQTDAVLLQSLDLHLFGGWDYVGSPWIPPIRALVVGRRIYVYSESESSARFSPARRWGRRLEVGNGGLSTRRVEAMLKLTRWASQRFPMSTRAHVFEDAFLCAVGTKRGLRIMPTERAENIYCETGAQGLTHVPDVYGFHGLRRWNAVLADLILASVPE